MLDDAGFDDIGIEVLPRRHAFGTLDDLDRFCKAQVFGNPLAEQVRARGGNPEAVAKAIRDDLRAELNGGPLSIQAIFYRARKPY